MEKDFIHSRLSDFNRWAEQQRRTLTEKSTNHARITEFADTCAKIRDVVAVMLAGGTLNIRFLGVEALKSNHHLYEVSQFRAAYKAFSGTRLRPARLTDAGDLMSLLDPPKDEPLTLDGRHDNYESWAVFHFGEVDGERHTIQTIPCSDPGLLHRFQESGNNVIYNITGILLPEPLSQEYLLLLLDLKTLDNPLDLVEPTPAELELAMKLIRDHSGTSLLKFIREKVMAELGILDNGDPLFTEAIEMAIVQAGSHGLMRQESARVHIFLIGPPASSKAQVAKVVEALQPVCVRVEAQAVTEDGLYGNSGLSQGRRVVRVGLIPQSHNGAFVIEDFHMANSLKNRRLTTSFTYTMERGRCEAANASRMSYPAEVAFYIDANRLSDVDARRSRRNGPAGLTKVTSDTGMPTNTLTRIDYVAEFARDPRRQLDLALRIARQPLQKGAHLSADGTSWTRISQVALAVLRSVHPQVEIDEAVAAYLEKRYRSVINVDANVFLEHPEYADFMSRGSKTYRKLVMANARLCNRSHATKEDVDTVFPYVLRRFEVVLTWLVGDTGDEVNQTARKAAALMMLRMKFGGKTVTTDEVVRCLSNMSRKTATRYLQDELRATKNADGSWIVPAGVGERNDSGSSEIAQARG